VLESSCCRETRASLASLSLRFNHGKFCDELYVHRKTPRLLSSRAQALFLTAG
jgi:hypothetical protein